MQYISKYKSPLGEIIITTEETRLTGLAFSSQKFLKTQLDKENIKKEIPIIKNTKKWLDIYFSGQEPDFNIPLHFTGTRFQNEVWKILCSIPYGKTMTYGNIANILAKRKKIKKMSTQAVGRALGKNKILIIVPCHRVIGTNSNLTGYAGGLKRKIALLNLEKK